MIFAKCGAVASQIIRDLPSGYINIVSNGNFANGVTGFTAVNSTLSVVSNVLFVTGNSAAYAGVQKITTTMPIDGHKYFFAAKIKVNNTVSTKLRVMISTQNSSSQVVQEQLTPIQNTVYLVDNIYTWNSGYNNEFLRYYAYHYYADAATGNGKIAEMQELVGCDLTTNGLADKDIAWCEANILPNVIW